MSRPRLLDLLSTLGLDTAGEALERQRSVPALTSLSFDERLVALLEAELNAREDRRLKRLLKQAKLRFSAHPEEIQFLPGRELDRSLIGELLSPSWIERHLNLVISGSTGTGKTWLACAIGMQAIRNGFSVAYHRVGTVLEDLELAHIDGSIVRMRSSLTKPTLLILDDFGTSTLNERNKQDLFDIIEARGERASTIIAGQLHWEEWHGFIGAPHLADAIVDRVVHRAHKLDLRGESLRQVFGREV